MLALRVVEHLDVVEHVSSRFLAPAMDPAPDPFALEQVEDALGDGIVMAVALRLMECSRSWLSGKRRHRLSADSQAWSWSYSMSLAAAAITRPPFLPSCTVAPPGPNDAEADNPINAAKAWAPSSKDSLR